MIYKIDYTYKVDGFYESINYYKSVVPMNTASMPPPAAIGINSLSYTDNDIGAAGKHYVRFSTVRDQTEKFSNETIVLAGKFQTFFNTDNSQIVDLCPPNAWENTGTSTISNDSIVFGSSALINRNKTVNFNNDFHIHLRHKIPSLITANLVTVYRSIASLASNPRTPLLGYTGSGQTGSSANTGSNVKNRYVFLLWGVSIAPYYSLSNIVPNTEYELDLIRKNNTFYFYVDKQLQFSFVTSYFGALATSADMFFNGLAGVSIRDVWVKTDTSDIVLPA